MSVTSHEYDADGRLTKIASVSVGDPSTVWIYTHNENGKVTESAEGKVIRTNYHRDQQGRKISVRTFSPEVLEQYRCVGTDSFWHAVESGIGVPAVGSVVTVYDDRDLPIEMRVLDSKGRALTRFVRTYDGNGLMLEEHEILENPALGMVERLSADQGSEFDEKHLEAANKAMRLMMAGKNGTASGIGTIFKDV